MSSSSSIHLTSDIILKVMIRMIDRVSRAIAILSCTRLSQSLSSRELLPCLVCILHASVTLSLKDSLAVLELLGLSLTLSLSLYIYII